MRFVNLAGRAAVIVNGLVLDLEHASGGRFGPDPQSSFDRWTDLRAWFDTIDRARPPASLTALDQECLGPFSPRPRQVFAIGLNYRGHAQASKRPIPDVPTVFTKFPSCLTGPNADIHLTGEHNDWEVELVIAIGREARGVQVGDAWSYVAGLSVGQDIGDRIVQMEPPHPQYSLGKSFATFGPIGPVLVTPDEFSDPDDLEVTCRLNGDVVQHDRTSGFIFTVSDLVAYLSSIVTLYPGDLVFTGTPAGVGFTRTPPRYLAAGDILESEISGIGTIRNLCVARPPGVSHAALARHRAL